MVSNDLGGNFKLGGSVNVEKGVSVSTLLPKNFYFTTSVTNIALLMTV